MKEYLSDKKVAFTEYDVSKDRAKAMEMVDKTKQMGVPVILVNDEVVVGFNKTALDTLLAE